MGFRGRKGIVLIIITAYRPQENSDPYTVYQQNIQSYTSKSNTKCPIVSFEKDLVILIGNWIENGNQAILLIDTHEGLTEDIKGIFATKWWTSDFRN